MKQVQVPVQVPDQKSQDAIKGAVDFSKKAAIEFSKSFENSIAAIAALNPTIKAPTATPAARVGNAKFCNDELLKGRCIIDNNTMLRDCPGWCKPPISKENNNCQTWADTGECVKNPSYMLLNCPRSCANKDKLSDCKQRADADQCATNSKLMLYNCPVSCNTKDKDTICSIYKQNNYCSNIPDHLLSNCPTSCSQYIVDKALDGKKK